MAINELTARQGNVNLEAVVTDKQEPREFEKFGKKGKVCNATIKDDTGNVTLTLWNEQVDSVGVGDKIKIENGWVSEWQGALQLSTGKFGKLEILEKGKAEEPKPEKKKETDEGSEEVDFEEEFLE